MPTNGEATEEQKICFTITFMTCPIWPSKVATMEVRTTAKSNQCWVCERALLPSSLKLQYTTQHFFAALPRALAGKHSSLFIKANSRACQYHCHATALLPWSYCKRIHSSWHWQPIKNENWPGALLTWDPSVLMKLCSYVSGPYVDCDCKCCSAAWVICFRLLSSGKPCSAMCSKIPCRELLEVLGTALLRRFSLWSFSALPAWQSSMAALQTGMQWYKSWKLQKCSRQWNKVSTLQSGTWLQPFSCLCWSGQKAIEAGDMEKKLANEACINETRKAIEACNLRKKATTGLLQKNNVAI